MNDKLLIIPEEEYHAASRRGEYLSSHNLAKFRESGPAYYRAFMDGLVPEPKREAYAFGSAAHKLILEGEDAFLRDYVVSDGPINEKTGEPFGKLTKVYKEWLDSQAGEVISCADAAAIHAMDASVKSHPVAGRLFSSGVPERVVRAVYAGKPCQIRMDWFDDIGIVDLKTTADLDWFDSDLRRFGYVYQGSFYREVLVAAFGGEAKPVTIVAIEKQPPYRTGVWTLSTEVLIEAASRNEAAINRMLECERTSVWPTGFEDSRIVVDL